MQYACTYVCIVSMHIIHNTYVGILCIVSIYIHDQSKVRISMLLVGRYALTFMYVCTDKLRHTCTVHTYTYIRVYVRTFKAFCNFFSTEAILLANSSFSSSIPPSSSSPCCLAGANANSLHHETTNMRITSPQHHRNHSIAGLHTQSEVHMGIVMRAQTLIRYTHRLHTLQQNTQYVTYSDFWLICHRFIHQIFNLPQFPSTNIMCRYQ